MLRDLDARLSESGNDGGGLSLAAYEEELFVGVIPLLHGTFEELDDTSSEVLRMFFESHGSAVRLSTAKSLRRLLSEGGSIGTLSTGSHSELLTGEEVSSKTTLQEFAIRKLLDEGEDVISKVIVGGPKTEYLLEAVRAAGRTP